MNGIRAYAWIHFASATLVQTSLMPKAISTGDAMLAEFDKRFTEDGEALTPNEMERALGQFEGRLHALETVAHSPADLTAALAEFRSEIDALRARYDATDDSDTRDRD